ncbi:MAG: ABC transporter permease [Promethearchaeota archaeon]
MKHNFIKSIFSIFNNKIIAPIKRYETLVEKELKILFNDRTAMIIVLLIPIIVVGLLTVVYSNMSLFSNDQNNSNSQLSQINQDELPIIGIIDNDKSQGFLDRDLSLEFMQDFQKQANDGYCQLIQSANQSELENMIGRGELDIFIIIPNMFEYNLSIHLPVIVPIVMDSLKSKKLQSMQILIDAVIEEFKQDNGFTGVFNVNKIQLNVPEKAQAFFASLPFILPLVIFGIGCLTATQSIVNDIPKDRMVLTPTNKGEMIAAKVTANILLQLIVALIFIIGGAISGLKIRSSYIEYFIILFFMVLNAVVFGVMISAMAKTPLSALQFFIFFFIFQTIGIFYISNPIILNLLPMYNNSVLILRIVLRGQSFWSVRQNILYLLAETAVIYIIAYLFFKKQKNLL